MSTIAQERPYSGPGKERSRGGTPGDSRHLSKNSAGGQGGKRLGEKTACWRRRGADLLLMGWGEDGGKDLFVQVSQKDRGDRERVQGRGGSAGKRYLKAAGKQRSWREDPVLWKGSEWKRFQGIGED